MSDNILDTLPAPTFDPMDTPVENTNIVDDGWLKDLLDTTPDIKDVSSVTSDESNNLNVLPDVKLEDEMFISDNHIGNLPDLKNNYQEGSTSESEQSQLIALVKSIVDKQNLQDSENEFNRTLEERMKEVLSTFGEADESILNDYPDLVGALRTSIGRQVTEPLVRENLSLKRDIDLLKSKIEEFSKRGKNDLSESDNKTGPLDHMKYRNHIVDNIPNYAKIVNSNYFKQLLLTPVDNHNPKYTYNVKIGNMFRDQDTSGIVALFKDINDKISNSKPGNIVVDNGVRTVNPISNNTSITPEKFIDISKQIMEGGVNASEAQMAQLRKALAATMKR